MGSTMMEPRGNGFNINMLNTPGERLKHLRQMARLTRSYLEKTHHLPAVTLKSWENGTARLTPKGIDRCMEIYRQEGIVCSKEWILGGIGLNPSFSVDLGKYFIQERRRGNVENAHLLLDQVPNSFGQIDDETLQSEDMCMAREASFFKESYNNAVVMVVPDENMGPQFNPGDYVGGRFYYSGDIDKALNKDCIIRLQNDQVVFRRLCVSETDGTYNLAFTNPYAKSEEPVLFNQTVASAAPIVWHRCNLEH